MMQEELFNIAQYLPAMARSAPERPAVLVPHRPDDHGRTALTFRQLNDESDQLAWGLTRLGLKPGERTLLMVRPGLDFISLTFALFKAGAVPVLIDPGMGRKNLLNCVRQSRPEVLIAVPLAHAFRVLLAPAAFDSVRLSVTVGHRWFWGGPTLKHVRLTGQDDKPFPMAETTRGTQAAILFTSGGTGIPKGVVYKHGMFDAQLAIIRDVYGIQPGEVDLPAFPLFALFSTALGTTCVIPDMDPTRPAQCDPAKIVGAIRERNVTYTFGSPSIWKRVGPYCAQHNIKLPSLKRILMAGAPVRGEVLAPFRDILEPGADTFIPYGATEALPVASIRGSEVLAETWALTRQGRGYCVGYPVPGVTVKVVRRDDASEIAAVPPGEIGEIIVSGPVVTEEYFDLPDQTCAAKIYETVRDPEPGTRNPAVWHRMGDMGYFDEKGRLWFCGRKAHRVIMDGGKVLYSVCVEAIFNAALEEILAKKQLCKPERAVARTALVGVGAPGRQVPAIVIEFTDELYDAFFVLGDLPHDPRPERPPKRLTELPRFNAWFAAHPLHGVIQHVLEWHEGFPVDVRHNAKINREELSRWAETLLSTLPRRERSHL